MIPPLLSACTQIGLSVSQYFFDLVPRDSDRTDLLKPSIPADLSCIWLNMFSVRIAIALIQRFPFSICTGIGIFYTRLDTICQANFHTEW